MPQIPVVTGRPHQFEVDQATAGSSHKLLLNGEEMLSSFLQPTHENSERREVS